MTILGLLAGLLTLMAAGFGATLLLMRGVARVNVFECAALSWLLGTGVVSLLLWVGGLLTSGAPLQIGVAIAAVGLAAAGVVSVRGPHAQFSLPRPRNSVEWTLVAIIAVEGLIMFYGAASHGLGWDGVLNWEVKARYGFLNDGVIPAAYYSSETRAFTHPAYPLLIPLTELWLYLCMGEPHQFWIKIIFPAYYAAGAVLLVIAAQRLTSQRWPGLASAALLFFVPFLSNSPGNATGGYVDVPLGMLYLATFAYLIVFAFERDAAALRLYAVCLALLPWAKREGAILWFIAAVCGAVVIWRSARTWRALLWLLPGGAILVAWKLYMHAMHTTAAVEFVPMSLATLQANSGRFLPIAQLVVAEMVETSRWSLFWLGAVASLAYLACEVRDRRVLLLGVAVGAPIALYAATYVFSIWPDYTLHFEASFSRLLLHVMPVAWLVIALAMPRPRATKIAANSAAASPL